MKKWGKIREVRESVLKALEEERQNGHIGHPLEASVTLKVDREMHEVLESLTSQELADIFIVSRAALSEEMNDNTEVEVEHAPGQKCERCWKYSETVGKNSKHPTICARCASVLESEGMEP